MHSYCRGAPQLLTFLAAAGLWTSSTCLALSCEVEAALLACYRYRLRAKVDLDDVSAEQKVWVRFGSGAHQSAQGNGWCLTLALRPKHRTAVARLNCCLIESSR